MRNYFEEMNIDYDELKKYEEIETYYDEVKDYSNLIQELQCDRVEALKQIVNKNKEIERLNNIIKEVREKIESVQMLGLRSGKTLIATLLNDILEILDKEKKCK